MSFDYSTLITNRARSDSDTLKALLSKPMAEWTAEERTAFNGAVMRGSYDYTDLNRVDACLEDLVARLGRVGCNVPGYERLKIPRTAHPSGRLPEGYTELEYIQSSGTQWIDTKVKPTVNTKFSFGVYMLEQTGGCIIGNSLNDDNDYRIFNYSGAIYWDFKDSRIIGTARSFPENTYFEFECGNNYVKKNGQQVLTGQKISVFTSNVNIFAFSNGAPDGCSGRLYFLKILEGDSLIRDFVPCIRNDRSAGMFDLVEQKFYGNTGTGSFTAGPVVTWEDKPEEPTETLDPYTWYESDVPTVSLLAHYRANVAAVRSALRLPEETPGVPETMRRLTTTEANNIEAILLALNFILNNIPAAVRHCGVTVCGSKGVRA